MASQLTARNIYEQQAHNKRSTWLVMFGVVLFLGFLGFGFDYYYLGLFEDGFYFPIGTIIAVIFGSGMAVRFCPVDGGQQLHQRGKICAHRDGCGPGRSEQSGRPHTHQCR